MEKIPLIMQHIGLDDIPFYPLPAGFKVRNYKNGDERFWADVIKEAGEFESVDSGLKRFEQEFGNYTDEMQDRCFFLEDIEGKIVGTITAWYNNNFQGEDYGKIHWVAIHPSFQGKKLAKPFLSIAMKRLAKSHNKAYLKTYTKNIKAINLYLDFGFKPLIMTDTCTKGWNLVSSVLRHSALNFADLELYET